jgi:flagellar hook-associated protein 2
MAGINIPGVSDKYKTDDLVESLMKVERIPLTREQDSLDKYKDQQNAWRDVNQKMSSLRESVKTLYSFDNPFNNKLTSSTEENNITATAKRNAEFGSFNVKVITPATADRFMSDELQKDYSVPEGTYTFQVNDKSVSMNWKGGKLSDFIAFVNKRGNNIIKSDVIGMNNGTQSLLIESLKTGSDNRLEFKDDALSFAKSVHLISPVKPETETFGIRNSEIIAPEISSLQIIEQNGMPEISEKNVSANNQGITVPPRGGLMLQLPEKYRNTSDVHVEFTLAAVPVPDITAEINEMLKRPVLPDTGKIDFGGVTVENGNSETSLPAPPFQELKPVEDKNEVFIRMADGSMKALKSSAFENNAEKGESKISINADDYPGIQALVIINRNTGMQMHITPVSVYIRKDSSGFAPDHPISTAGDAEIQYEGITIKRPTNTIDDVIPSVTLNIKDKTKDTATISIKPDTDSAKQALITFIGKYNQAIAEMNILSQDKPEIIQELDYLTDDEKKTEEKKLGMFLGDFSLTNAKSQLQTIVSANYKYSDKATLTMLNQIGISTQASGGGSGYTPGRLRGYLEVDEKKLDSSLGNNLDAVKNLFGYDSDGDLIIDSGIGYAIDRQLTAYIQSGGIIAGKTNALDTQIKASEGKITKLQTQLDAKESELKEKYGQMESTLNNLETQKNTISNFSNQRNND